MISLESPHKPLELKNRSVMAPMTRYSCDSDGIPSKEMGDYYVRRAENDIGLIVVESCAINPNDAMGYVGGAQFHSENHVKAWKPIINRIHNTGSKVWLQLFHAGRLTVEEITNCNTLAPSAIKTSNYGSFWRPKYNGEIVHFQTKTPYLTPAPMTIADIKRIIKDFSESCKLAELAGFDGIELHGAHGYLLHQFANSVSNKRKDKYGVLDGVSLFNTELVRACRRSTNIKISYRLSTHFVDNPYIKYNEKEMNLPLLIEKLDSAGVDFFHSSEIKAGSKIFGADFSLLTLIKNNTDKPVIACGGINNSSLIDTLLKTNQADLIAFGRVLISNPQLITKLRNDAEGEIIPFKYESHINTVY